MLGWRDSWHLVLFLDSFLVCGFGCDYRPLHLRSSHDMANFLQTSTARIKFCSHVRFQSQRIMSMHSLPACRKHYYVALLQADRRYGLESTSQRGDRGDLYSTGDASFMLNSITTPNTNSYQVRGCAMPCLHAGTPSVTMRTVKKKERMSPISSRLLFAPMAGRDYQRHGDRHRSPNWAQLYNVLPSYVPWQRDQRDVCGRAPECR